MKVKVLVALQLHGLYSPPGSSVHGILQARILEWVAISFSNGSSQTRGRTHVSDTGRWIPSCRDTWETLISVSLPIRRGGTAQQDVSAQQGG